MPRTPRLGPPVLRIEGISDGAAIHLEPIIDDFTGQVIPYVDGPPKGPLADGPQRQLAMQQERADRALGMLQAVGLVDTALRMPLAKPKALRLVRRI